jgi:hypothetical protein
MQIPNHLKLLDIGDYQCWVLYPRKDRLGLKRLRTWIQFEKGILEVEEPWLVTHPWRDTGILEVKAA